MPSQPELLDIKQAAALLQVSEASLRRWTDAGKLACYRVGGRRERRFRRADLLAFLESSPRTPHNGSGHLCGVYSSDLGRSRQAAAFLGDHLGGRDVCFLVMAPEAREQALALLEQRRPSVRSDVAAGRLVVGEYADDAAPQIASWASQLGTALAAGARSLRVVGDVSGSLGRRSTFEEVLEYEAEYERSISQRFPVTTLCQYDARTLSGVETTRVLRVHGDLFRHPVDQLMA